MSMILEALTRAEQERQIESQPNLKFVTPVKQRRKNASRAWVWITAALIANAVVLAIFLRPDTGQSDARQIAFNTSEQTNTGSLVSKPASTIAEEETVVTQVPTESTFENNEVELTSVSDVRPLSMEVEENAEPKIDRPLIYESNQDENEQPPIVMQHNKEDASVASLSKKGSVSFSENELSLEEFEQPITNAPKLLIDQGNEELPSQVNSSNVPALKDLPLSSRNTLSQYEVNVHVFDDNPEQRFVLINMDKYKEGDRVVNNGPIVDEITREGVIIDYGSGKALLPPK